MDTKSKLREKIARKFLEYDFDRHGVKYGVLADEILPLIKEAGYTKLTPRQLHILKTCSGHHL